MEKTGVKLKVCFFIDAFGQALLERHPNFLREQFPHRKPLETIFGYSSACDPSIITGRPPQQHGHWSSFYYSPHTSPFTWLKPLSILPKAVFDRARPRHYMSKLISKVCGFTGYFQVYSLPWSVLPLFDYVEKERYWKPNGMVQGRSVFDDLADRNLSYYVGDQDSEEMQFAKLEHHIHEGKISFAYILLGKLDALMHAEGPFSPNIEPLLQAYEHKIDHLLTLARKKYGEVDAYTFSDHGMHEVTHTFDLQGLLHDAGAVWGKDYVAMFDSTMARFWFPCERGKAKVLYHLSQVSCGRIVTDEELQSFGTFFPDHKFGEVIFLMDAGTLIVPSFMGLRACRGMHGYHPQDEDSLACLMSTTPIPSSARKITDIYSLWR